MARDANNQRNIAAGSRVPGDDCVHWIQSCKSWREAGEQGLSVYTSDCDRDRVHGVRQRRGWRGSSRRNLRTHFSDPSPGSFPTVKRELQLWERIYNTVRPHQVLNYLTPAEFLHSWLTQPKF